MKVSLQPFLGKEMLIDNCVNVVIIVDGDEREEDGEDLGEGSDLGEDGDGDNAKADDWQKKEFVARPYEAPETEAAVRGLTF
jgi:hypothetical protein